MKWYTSFFTDYVENHEYITGDHVIDLLKRGYGVNVSLLTIASFFLKNLQY